MEKIIRLEECRGNRLLHPAVYGGEIFLFYKFIQIIQIFITSFRFVLKQILLLQIPFFVLG